MPTTEPDPYKDPADYYGAVDEATDMADVEQICDDYRTRGESWRSASNCLQELEQPDLYDAPADFFEAIDGASTMAEKNRICSTYSDRGHNWRTISDCIQGLEE